jgi:hypothetical protein
MNNTRRRSPVEGLDYGGPAVIEPRLLRPETLRRHLSVGLPFAKPKTLSDISSDATPIYVTQGYRPFGHNFTLHLASAAVQEVGRRNRETPHEQRSPKCAAIAFVAVRCFTRSVTNGVS